MIATATSPRLAEIEQKVVTGKRLTKDDGLVLFDPATPLSEVGGWQTWFVSGCMVMLPITTSTRT